MTEYKTELFYVAFVYGIYRQLNDIHIFIYAQSYIWYTTQNIHITKTGVHTMYIRLVQTLSDKLFV